MADVVRQMEEDDIDITIVHDHMSSGHFRELFRVECVKLFRVEGRAWTRGRSRGGDTAQQASARGRPAP
eukprot:9118826-Pyramimonas_sp.AAC.1